MTCRAPVKSSSETREHFNGGKFGVDVSAEQSELCGVGVVVNIPARVRSSATGHEGHIKEFRNELGIAFDTAGKEAGLVTG